jgi:cytoskeletal protein RodZ
MSRRPDREAPDTPRDPASAPWKRKGEGAASFGGWLRQQREIRNLTLREIADSTKIGMRYLEALETDRFERLPAPVFAKGFLRQYARYVGLDADEVVNFYLQASRDDDEADDEADRIDPPVASRPVRRPTRQSMSLLGIVVASLILVGLLFYFREEVSLLRDVEDSPGIAPPVSVAPPEAPPEPEASPAEESTTIRVTLAFTGECWVEARVDGERTLSELRVQGESVQLEGERSVELTLGEPGNVRIEVNGQEFDPGVSAGRVARGILIDREAAGLPALSPVGDVGHRSSLPDPGRRPSPLAGAESVEAEAGPGRIRPVAP